MIVGVFATHMKDLLNRKAIYLLKVFGGTNGCSLGTEMKVPKEHSALRV